MRGKKKKKVWGGERGAEWEQGRKGLVEGKEENIILYFMSARSVNSDLVKWEHSVCSISSGRVMRIYLFFPPAFIAKHDITLYGISL